MMLLLSNNRITVVTNKFWFLKVLLLFALVVGLLSASDAVLASSSDKDNNGNDANNKVVVDDVIEWIQSKGGYIHDGLEFRNFGNNNNNRGGVFTTVPLSKGDTIMKIPQACLISSGNGSGNECDTAKNIARERLLGDESEYAPYINYLFDDDGQSLPSQFSDDAKDIIERIVGLETPTANSMTDMTYHRFCGDYEDTDDIDPALLEKSYSFHLSRSNWHDKMIPGYDMINHRNGSNEKYRNVDSTATQDGINDITVFATRDILPQEQLLYSYVNVTDSQYGFEYVLQHILRDYGFVEHMPQRWKFKPGGEYDLIFELNEKDDKDNNNKEEEELLELTWLESGEEQDEVESWGLPEHWGNGGYSTITRYLRAHVTRLQNIEKYVTEGVQDLGSSHERDTILEFYNAMVTAMKHALWSADDAKENINEQKCSDAEAKVAAAAEQQEQEKYLEEEKEVAIASTATCKAKKYDALSTTTTGQQQSAFDMDFQQMHSYICDVDREWERYGHYDVIDNVESHYQEFQFERRMHPNGNIADTCLRINGRLNVCDSLRPQYHEPLIHLPARYLDESPRRVLYMGGGDNMVLHEILRFPSLELVVGLELDQKIVRNSFKYFRTQPHWDIEKVQWWYGDAAKSFLMLPQEYYGTFDLVVVDLESDVISHVWITEDLNIMDGALLLLTPKGVIARNVDVGFDRNHRFTDYELNLSCVDIPMFCYAGITVGSNSVDFLTQKPKDHNIEMKYLKPANDEIDQYDMFYNYHKNTDNTIQLDSCCRDLLANAKIGNAGVMMIVEAEDVTTPLEPLSSPEDTTISEALSRAGLTQLRTKISSTEGGGAILIFVLEEGYIVARLIPELRYVAFDIQLWTRFGDLDKVRNELIVAVGGQVAGESSSSYRIVTGGMYGVSKPESSGSETYSCPCPAKTGEDEDLAGDVHDQDDNVKRTSLTVLAESISLTQDQNAPVVVLCGEEGGVQSCSALQTLMKSKDAYSQKIVPLWTCPNVASATGGMDDEALYRNMYACETDTLQRLEELVEKNGKIGGIVFTPEVPRSMGEVLHKILSSKKHQRGLLADSYVFLEMSLPGESESSWRKAFLERFRTDLAKYDPAYHAEILFNETKTTSSLGLGVFSKDDAHFFSHLVDMVGAIESKTGYVGDVRTIRNGKNSYAADFTPTMVFDHDGYDHSPADKQWDSQNPLGRQTIVQHEIKETDSSTMLASQFKKDLKKALQKTLKIFGDYDMKNAEVIGYNVGDGCVIAAFWSTGNAVVSWDGRDHVDLNLFSFDEYEDDHYDFMDEFVDRAPQPLEVVAHDEQPRGIGRVVNFKDEIRLYETEEVKKEEEEEVDDKDELDGDDKEVDDKDGRDSDDEEDSDDVDENDDYAVYRGFRDDEEKDDGSKSEL